MVMVWRGGGRGKASNPLPPVRDDPGVSSRTHDGQPAPVPGQLDEGMATI